MRWTSSPAVGWVSSLSLSLQQSQRFCSADNKLQGCCKACFFFFLYVFLHNGGSLVWQNCTNHQWTRAESPCTWAGIQEDTLPMVNHHPNNVTQFIPGWTAPICKLLDAAFVVKYLDQQWIFPSFYSSLLIPVEEFVSYISSFLRLLPSAAAVVHLFLMPSLFFFAFVCLNHTHLMIKDCSSATARQTNGAYLTIMQNIRADIKYLANCQCRFI